MGFSGGGANVTKAHQHDGTVVQDGGSLAANATQFGLTNGSLLYSDGTNIQELGVGSSGYVLGTASGTTPTWEASAAAIVMNTNGQMVYFDGSRTALDIGSTNDVMTVSGGLPVWQAPAAGGAWTEIESQTDGDTLVIGEEGGSTFSPYRFIHIMGQYTGGGNSHLGFRWFDSATTILSYDGLWSAYSTTSPIYYQTNDAVTMRTGGYTATDAPIFFDIKFPVEPADATAGIGMAMWKTCSSSNDVVTYSSGVGWINSANDLAGFFAYTANIASSSCSYVVLGIT